MRDVLDRLGVARRVGQYRVCADADLPKVETELRRRGYLPEAAEAGHA
jgi:hypothetical protein